MDHICNLFSHLTAILFPFFCCCTRLYLNFFYQLFFVNDQSDGLEFFWEPLWNMIFGFNYKRMLKNSIATDAWHLPSFVFADDPTNDANIEGDPYKTLFVARIVSAWIYPFIIFVLFVLSIIFSLTKWIVSAPHMGHKISVKDVECYCFWCRVMKRLSTKSEENLKGMVPSNV